MRKRVWILSIVFIILSYHFLFRCPPSTYQQLNQILRQIPSVECPKNISIYRIFFGNKLYKLQIQNCPNHKKGGSLRWCIVEDFHGSTSRSIHGSINNRHEILIEKLCKKVDYHMENYEETSSVSRCNKIDGRPRNVDETPGMFDIPSFVWGIYPGTLWCGYGNDAGSIYNRLGRHWATDSCCRDHDLCKPIIGIMEHKYYFKNTRLVPVSHCSCDAQFYNCLKRVNSTVSNEVGVLFFNVGQLKCFDFEEVEQCGANFLSFCYNRKTECSAVLRNNPRY